MTGSGRLTDTTDPRIEAVTNLLRRFTQSAGVPNGLIGWGASVPELLAAADAVDPKRVSRPLPKEFHVELEDDDDYTPRDRGPATHILLPISEVESLRTQLAAARRTEAETKAEALTELRAEIVKEGRSAVEWLAKTAGDAVDRARLIGAEDAYKDALRILDARRAASLLAQPETPKTKKDGNRCPNVLINDRCIKRLYHDGRHDYYDPALVLPEESTTEPNRANPVEQPETEGAE